MPPTQAASATPHERRGTRAATAVNVGAAIYRLSTPRDSVSPVTRGSCASRRCGRRAVAKQGQAALEVPNRSYVGPRTVRGDAVGVRRHPGRQSRSLGTILHKGAGPSRHPQGRLPVPGGRRDRVVAGSCFPEGRRARLVSSRIPVLRNLPQGRRARPSRCLGGSLTPEGSRTGVPEAASLERTADSVLTVHDGGLDGHGQGSGRSLDSPRAVPHSIRAAGPKLIRLVRLGPGSGRSRSAGLKP